MITSGLGGRASPDGLKGRVRERIVRVLIGRHHHRESLGVWRVWQIFEIAEPFYAALIRLPDPCLAFRR